LACLECLVHVRDPGNLPPLVYAEVAVSDRRIRLWEKDYTRTEAILESLVLSREVGDEWINSRPGTLSRERIERPVLQVPSVIVPQEWNYLINPASPLFRDITWSEPKPFKIDPRLL
jgi:RES domain-containing protein